MESDIARVIQDEVASLSPESQKQVLDFVITLKAQQRGNLRERLWHHAGTIARDDLAAMDQAIQQECEQVDLNEW